MQFSSFIFQSSIELFTIFHPYLNSSAYSIWICYVSSAPFFPPFLLPSSSPQLLVFQRLSTFTPRGLMYPTQMHHFWTQNNRIKPILGYAWLSTIQQQMKTPKCQEFTQLFTEAPSRVPTTLEPLLTTKCAGQLFIKWQLGYLLIISSEYQNEKNPATNYFIFKTTRTFEISTIM